MNIYKLETIENYGHDAYHGFVIVAETAKEAREG